MDAERQDKNPKRARPEICGFPVDDQTRCVHYHSSTDIIAIRFKCCNRYYPCFECHEESAGHSAVPWAKSEWHKTAILCGNCGSELTIAKYLSCGHTCPACSASFNPKCSNHYHLYFEGL
ncbi:MAG: hypothetical protein JST46_05675 [Bacteroidetes bacterium]|nr:hypothetical protein [Bacteroidota bacterium]